MAYEDIGNELINDLRKKTSVASSSASSGAIKFIQKKMTYASSTFDAFEGIAKYSGGYCRATLLNGGSTPYRSILVHGLLPNDVSPSLLYEAGSSLVRNDERGAHSDDAYHWISCRSASTSAGRVIGFSLDRTKLDVRMESVTTNADQMRAWYYDGHFYVTSTDSAGSAGFLTKINATTLALVWTKKITGYYFTGVAVNSNGIYLLIRHNSANQLRLVKADHDFTTVVRNVALATVSQNSAQKTKLYLSGNNVLVATSLDAAFTQDYFFLNGDLTQHWSHQYAMDVGSYAMHSACADGQGNFWVAKSIATANTTLGIFRLGDTGIEQLSTVTDTDVASSTIGIHVDSGRLIAQDERYIYSMPVGDWLATVSNFFSTADWTNNNFSKTNKSLAANSDAGSLTISIASSNVTPVNTTYSKNTY